MGNFKQPRNPFTRTGGGKAKSGICYSSAMESPLGYSPLKQVAPGEEEMEAERVVGEESVEENTVAGQFLTPTGDGKFYDEDNDITFFDPHGIVEMLDEEYPEDLDYIYKIDSEGNHIITGVK